MVPLFHYVASLCILIPLSLSIVNFFKAVNVSSGRVYAAATVLLIAGIVLIFWYSRAFALRAQDRAIRAEENLRYFAITGKLLNPKLRMGQIIALRFASDTEFVNLAHRAVEENLSAKEIKQAIKEWKEDYDRV